jgi:hypothetical protein
MAEKNPVASSYNNLFSLKPFWYTEPSCLTVVGRSFVTGSYYGAIGGCALGTYRGMRADLHRQAPGLMMRSVGTTALGGVVAVAPFLAILNGTHCQVAKMRGKSDKATGFICKYNMYVRYQKLSF